MKVLFKLVLILASIGLLAQLLNNGCGSKSQTELIQKKIEEVPKVVDTVVSEVSTENKMNKIKNDFIQKISQLNKDIDSYESANYIGKGKAKSNVEGAEQLNVWRASIIGYGPSATWSDSIPILLNLAKTKLIKIQRAEFPKYRADFAINIDELLWENDIDAKALGKSNDILELTGGLFATNRGKKQIQESLYESLLKLRFKKVIYKWYKGQNDFSYYKVDSDPDSYFE